jgi:hypothetical protein
MNMGSLPIKLVFDQSGQIGFRRHTDMFGRDVEFQTIIDQPEPGVQAIISVDDIYIGTDTVLEYNQGYRYKDMPELLAYLVALKLDSPV